MPPYVAVFTPVLASLLTPALELLQLLGAQHCGQALVGLCLQLLELPAQELPGLVIFLLILLYERTAFVPLFFQNGAQCSCLFLCQLEPFL